MHPMTVEMQGSAVERFAEVRLTGATPPFLALSHPLLRLLIVAQGNALSLEAFIFGGRIHYFPSPDNLECL